MTKKIKYIALLFTTLIVANIVNAQSSKKAAHWCLTDQNHETLLKEHPALIEQNKNQKKIF